jgi:hypothetical protein
VLGCKHAVLAASQVAYKRNSWRAWILVCSQWWTPPHLSWPQPELHHLDTVCWISRFSCQCHTPLGHTHYNISSNLGHAHSNYQPVKHVGARPLQSIKQIGERPLKSIKLLGACAVKQLGVCPLPICQATWGAPSPIYQTSWGAPFLIC